MPPGLTAYLRGIPRCSEAALSLISMALGTGANQIASPVCPSSLVGRAEIGVGAEAPYYVDTPRVYIAGPYKGAPLSLAIVAPAVAGPFDLGSEVVRTALHVDPVSTRIEAISDPIPLILKGALLNVRDIRVHVDRSGFILNPTNCSEMAVGAKVGSEKGATANLSDRFQVGECAALDFGPKLSVQLIGGTKRGKNPKLRAVLQPREGDANISRISVKLPRSALLDQGHIGTVCTRVQFAADACPERSIYGRATATTPLLDEQLSGPVYLRSSSNKLPDLVVALKGPASLPLEIEQSGRTDAVKGALRNTFDFVPDAPVSEFVLELFGGKRGLVVNSTNICKGKHMANIKMDGQNGKFHDFQTRVRNPSCTKRSNRAGKRAKRGLTGWSGLPALSQR